MGYLVSMPHAASGRLQHELEGPRSVAEEMVSMPHAASGRLQLIKVLYVS